MGRPGSKGSSKQAIEEGLSSRCPRFPPGPSWPGSTVDRRSDPYERLSNEDGSPQADGRVELESSRERIGAPPGAPIELRHGLRRVSQLRSVQICRPDFELGMMLRYAPTEVEHQPGRRAREGLLTQRSS